MPRRPSNPEPHYLDVWGMLWRDDATYKLLCDLTTLDAFKLAQLRSIIDAWKKAEPTMPHHCHWPGCKKEVPPKMWGCREHWYTLPKPLRDKVWAAYEPGQEITKTPSDDYIAVAQEVQEWIAYYEAEKGKQVAPEEITVPVHVEDALQEMVAIGQEMESAPERTLVAFDTETHPIGPGAVLPKLVCCSAAVEHDGEVHTPLESTHGDRGTLDALLDTLFGDDTELVGASTSYDLGVIAVDRPDLVPAIFKALVEGRVHDVQIREKMLNLATTGQLEYTVVEGKFDDEGDPVKRKVEYSLASLVKKYRGEDRTDEKKLEDAFRIHYNQLEDRPVSEWPQEAIDYAIADSTDALFIYHRQEEQRAQLEAEIGSDPLATEPFRCAVDFALRLLSAWGFATDPVAKAEVDQFLAEELKPENLALLVERGILRPGEPGRPHSNGAKNEDGTPKMTKGKPESINMTALRQYVVDLAATNDLIEIRKTAPSKRFPEGQVSVDAEWLEDFASLDPMLAQYKRRQDVNKLVTTEIPRLCWPPGSNEIAPVVHGRYDVLKATGRTSCFADKLYPSGNHQNLDPRIRKCYVPRPGKLLFSIDYSQMELGTAAQTCFDLFGFSVLKDKINAGVDVHAYMGAQLALRDEDFANWVGSEGATDADDIFKHFLTLDAQPGPGKDFYKHYRKFAKPTNLGYPGGLGPKTFVAYAKATYDVHVSLEDAQQFRETWLSTFPEFRQYFEWINNECIDPRNEGKYRYTSPMGLYRAGCHYCAAANGKALQTPSAEGATLALFEVVRACYDPEAGNELLFGGAVRPIAFVHDEIVGEIDDDELVSERVDEMKRLMVESMRLITPDVTPRANGALMRRWDKAAEPVYDAAGKLTVWEAKQ